MGLGIVKDEVAALGVMAEPKSLHAVIVLGLRGILVSFSCFVQDSGAFQGLF